MELIISKGKERVAMVRMTRKEAIQTIQSLTNQILENSPNSGRWECYTKEGIDFSIAVTPDNTKEEHKKEIQELHKMYLGKQTEMAFGGHGGYNLSKKEKR